MSDIIQFDYRQHWQERDIILKRPTSGDTSLGFTIAGGTDKLFLRPNFTSIIVTNISKNTIAHTDEGLKLYDIILRVNNTNFTNIISQRADDTLRKAGRKIKLIRRLTPPISKDIELEHNGKLGIFIAGGIGHEYFRDDHGIFITDIAQYQTNKQLYKGDRLLQISSACNTYDLRFVTHEIAKQHIQLACSESKKIILRVGRTTPIVEA
ncbi:unnamed protein product, partial [Rotaria sp. Silwood1]